jgi:hypothetical protein
MMTISVIQMDASQPQLGSLAIQFDLEHATSQPTLPSPKQFVVSQPDG